MMNEWSRTYFLSLEYYAMYMFAVYKLIVWAILNMILYKTMILKQAVQKLRALSQHQKTKNN